MKRLFKGIFLSVLFALLLSQEAFGATRTWAGSTHNWGTTAAWVELAIPTSSDTCVFNVNTTGTITIEGTDATTDICGSISFTGFTGTVTHAAGKQLNSAGNVTFVAGMTYAPSSTSILNFTNTSGTAQLTTAGKRVGSITINGVGGTTQFQDGVDNTSQSVITLTNGTLLTNNQTVGATSGVAFLSNNANTRALTMGTTTWNLGGPNVVMWDITNPTGMTLSAASSTIKWGTAGGDLTFNGGGLTYGTIQDLSPGNSIHLYAAADNFGTFTQTMNSGGSGSLQATNLGANITVSGTCTITGFSDTVRSFIRSNVRGTTRTLSCGTNAITRTDFQDITAAGSGSWDLHAVTGGSGDCGGNTGITFTTPIDAYFKTAVTVSWTAGTVWKTASGGSTGITNTIPLCQDTAHFDANSVTAGSVTINPQIQQSRLPAMDFTGVLNTPTIAWDQAGTFWSFFGNTTFISAMAVTGTSEVLKFEGRGSHTITTGGLTLTSPITVDAASGIWTQGDNFTDSRSATTAFVSTTGTWDSGTHNLTLSGSAAKLNIAGGTVKSAGTVSLTGTGGANLTISAGDFNAPNGIFSMTAANSTTTFTGGTAELGTLTRTGFAITDSGTNFTIGKGGAAYATPMTINSGYFKPINNALMQISGTGVTVTPLLFRTPGLSGGVQ